MSATFPIHHHHLFLFHQCKGSEGTHLSPMCLCFVVGFFPLCLSLIYIEPAEKEQTLLSLTLFCLCHTHTSLLHKNNRGDVSRWTKFALIKWNNKGRRQDYWEGWMDGQMNWLMEGNVCLEARNFSIWQVKVWALLIHSSPHPLTWFLSTLLTENTLQCHTDSSASPLQFYYAVRSLIHQQCAHKA